MKMASKITAFVLCFLLAFSTLIQVDAFAKAKPSPKKAEMVKAAVKTKVTKTKAVKAVPKGLAKGKKNGAKSPLPPVIKEGGVLIPVYAITRSYGAEVTYDAASHEVTITKGSKVIVINMDKKTALVNSTEFKLANEDSSGMIVPLDFIAEKLGITTTIGTSDETTTGTGITGTSDGTTTGTTTTGTTSTTTTGTADGTTTGTTSTTSTGTQTTTTGSGSTTAITN